MAGRPPKPTALKLVAGNPGKRGTNKHEPDPTYLEDLAAPAWLSAAAAAVWDEVAPHLARAKLLTEIDVQMLAKGCVAMAQYRQAVAQAGDELVKTTEAAEGDAEDAPKKGAHVNPWLIVQSMSFKQAMAVFQQFGMSPAARTRISVQPQMDLFSGKTGAANYFS